MREGGEGERLEKEIGEEGRGREGERERERERETSTRIALHRVYPLIEG